MDGPLALDSLPNELCAQIASYLDSEPPSVAKFDQEISMELTKSSDVSLKSLSCVSRRWRKICVEFLFQYVRVVMDDESHFIYLNNDVFYKMEAIELELSMHERSVLWNMHNEHGRLEYSEADDFYMIERAQNGDKFLETLAPTMWLPGLAKSFTDFSQFIQLNDLGNKVKSIVVQTDKETDSIPAGHQPHTYDMHITREAKKLWKQIFGLLEPLRVVVSASPTVLAGLLYKEAPPKELWGSHGDRHCIELLQAKRHRNFKDTWFRNTNSLIHRRPWYHFGYNEGSSTPGFTISPNNALRSFPCSLVRSLVADLSVREDFQLTSFAFKGVFPIAEQIDYMTQALREVPNLNEVSFQLTPLPGDDRFTQIYDGTQVHTEEACWEINEAFSHIADFVLLYIWNHGSKFIIRDAKGVTADRDTREIFDMLESEGWRSDGKEEVWILDSKLDVTEYDAVKSMRRLIAFKFLGING